MKKCTLKKRLVAAFNAFKNYGRPQLAPLLPRPYEIRHPNVRTIMGRAEYFYSGYGRGKTEVIEEAQQRIAEEIGWALLRTGCIRFTEDGCEMALIGKVEVIAPEKEAKR